MRCSVAESFDVASYLCSYRAVAPYAYRFWTVFNWGVTSSPSVSGVIAFEPKVGWFGGKLDPSIYEGQDITAPARQPDQPQAKPKQ